MTKELFCKLFDKLGRDPTDDEMADAMADLIDYAWEMRKEELMKDGHIPLLIFLANQS